MSGSAYRGYIWRMAVFTVLLGGNLGDVQHTFARAVARLRSTVGTVTAMSRDHVTEPWGFTDAHLFLNRAVQVESSAAPAEVMEQLLRIETELGRTRAADGRPASRTIDIDILFIADRVLHMPGLTVPHPRVHERVFALSPTADIAPMLVHPVLGRTIMELLSSAMR